MFLNKVSSQIKAFFKQGLSPHEISLTVTLGFFLGIIPVLGINSILCAIIALKLRLNLPVLMAINYILFPIQLILIIPFIKLSAFVFNLALTPETLAGKPGAFDWLQFISNLGMANLLAAGIWLAMFLIFGWPVYKALLIISTRISRYKKRKDN